MKKVIIGIDVSKLTLDICVQNQENVSFYTITNDFKSIKTFFKQFKNEEVLVAMENTGRYNSFLYEVLPDFSFSVYVINPLHLKKSMGLVRGKNDKVDSERIAWFLAKNYEDLKQWRPNSKTIEKIKLLGAERKHRVKVKAGLSAQSQDKEFINLMADKQLLKLNKELIDVLDKQIEKIEEKILQLINSEETLKNQYNRIQSIPGVGKVLAFNMLVKTNGFTDIHSPRKMACYAGVAPFEHQSGTSLKYKPKVSVFADKELKKLLHLSAMSAIRLNNDLAEYFKRKVSEGKNKMSVLNAVRNKIIHRIYALIKNETFYQNYLVTS